MIGIKETSAWLQIHALDQIRASHVATVAAVRGWAVAMATNPPLVSGWLDARVDDHRGTMTKDVKTVEEEKRARELKEAVDSWFAFAQQVLTLNRQFAHRLVIASRLSDASLASTD